MNDRSKPGPADPSRMIRTLAKRSGYTSFRLSSHERGLPFQGRTREWNIVALCLGDWLQLYTMVLPVPEEPGIRTRLLEATAVANDAMPLSKFSVSDGRLELKLEYRIEHVDAEVFGSAVGLLFEHAEEHYPRLFRIVTGDDVLERLEQP